MIASRKVWFMTVKIGQDRLRLPLRPKAFASPASHVSSPYHNGPFLRPKRTPSNQKEHQPTTKHQTMKNKGKNHNSSQISWPRSDLFLPWAAACESLVVIQHRVQVLDPYGINGPVASLARCCHHQRLTMINHYETGTEINRFGS